MNGLPMTTLLPCTAIWLSVSIIVGSLVGRWLKAIAQSYPPAK